MTLSQKKKKKSLMHALCACNEASNNYLFHYWLIDKIHIL